MQVAVLVSGVADPKWPLPRDLAFDRLQAHAAQYAILSPFDEAALELALKLRDSDPQVRIAALVAGDEPLARKVAGWRPDSIARVEFGAVARWDGGGVVRALVEALRSHAPDAALVLAGREFGDCDDGTVPATLACGIDAPYISLALSLQVSAGTLAAVRQAGGGLERVTLPPRALLSVTNDPGNRLRQPLMKNVMAARKVSIAVLAPDGRPIPAALQLDEVRAAPAPTRGARVERVTGSPHEKARALATVLLAQRRGAA